MPPAKRETVSSSIGRVQPVVEGAAPDSRQRICQAFIASRNVSWLGRNGTRPTSIVITSRQRITSAISSAVKATGTAADLCCRDAEPAGARQCLSCTVYFITDRASRCSATEDATAGDAGEIVEPLSVQPANYLYACP